MTRLRYLLYITFLFAVLVLGINILYTGRKHSFKDTAIHIVHSLEIYLTRQNGDKDASMTLNPHGNEVTDGKVIEVEPIVVKKPVAATKGITKTVLPSKENNLKEEIIKTRSRDEKTTESKPDVSKVDSSKKEGEEEGLCSKRGDHLVGALAIDRSVPDMEALVKDYSAAQGGLVEKGGWSKPKNCVARVKTAIIIPYRKREEQLKIYLKHMHPIFQRQQLHYRIFVIEQADDDPFNRAGLFNIGFTEALKFEKFDCFIFSDVDLLPEDDRNYYGCPTSPRHMSVAVDKFDYRLPYEGIFGGVGAFKRHDFQDVNGFSNMFWGWGGEDDDLYARIRFKGYQLTRPSIAIGRYTMILVHHFQSHGADPNRMNLLQTSTSRMSSDGLSSLKYKVKKVLELPLVTVVNVKLSKSMYDQQV